MIKFQSRGFRNLAVICALLVGSASFSGCVAGNYGFTRSVSKFNLKMSLVPRVLVYIAFIIIPVYGIAILLDLLINNTIEFWSGKAVHTAQNHTFEKDGLRIEVAHSLDPLRRSEFKSYNAKGELISTTELVEQESGAIAVIVNGESRGEVKMIDKHLIELLTFNQEPGLGLTVQHIDPAALGSLNGEGVAAVRSQYQAVQAYVQAQPKPYRLGITAAK